MEIVGLLLKQVLIMFALMGVGYIAYGKKWITDQGTKDIGKLLLNVAIPIIVISNFCVERTAEKTQDLLSSAALSILCMLISIVLSALVFHKSDRIGEFSAAFSNAGFIGIPLVQATFGSQAVFYISIMIVLISLLQWTYGVFTITDDKSVMDLKKVATNPIVISVLIGLVLYFGNIKLPAIVSNLFNTISGINTPLAMFSSGVYLAQSNLFEMLRRKQVYFVSLIRLLLIPLVITVVFRFLPFGSNELKLAILCAAACPVGSNVAIFAQQYDKDYKSGVEHVCVSTLLSILTLPLIVSLATLII